VNVGAVTAIELDHLAAAHTDDVLMCPVAIHLKPMPVTVERQFLHQSTRLHPAKRAIHSGQTEPRVPAPGKSMDFLSAQMAIGLLKDIGDDCALGCDSHPSGTQPFRQWNLGHNHFLPVYAWRRRRL
jgi:hypothetical protein